MKAAGGHSSTPRGTGKNAEVEWGKRNWDGLRTKYLETYGEEPDKKTWLKNIRTFKSKQYKELDEETRDAWEAQIKQEAEEEERECARDDQQDIHLRANE